MGTNSVVKLNFTGPKGEEMFLAVDFTNRVASLIVVDPNSGNVRVTEVQSIAAKGF